MHDMHNRLAPQKSHTLATLTPTSGKRKTVAIKGRTR
jgi:hypothetical protein